jgi:hypothetical protein
VFLPTRFQGFRIHDERQNGTFVVPVKGKALSLEKTVYKTTRLISSCVVVSLLQFLNEKLEKVPGGVKLVMKGKLNTMRQEFIALGYKYSSKRVLNFIMHPDFGTTVDGVPYEMKFVDPNGNLVVRNVGRPACVTEYYTYSNCVDTHNQLRQSEVGMEENWVTSNGYLRLVTTLIGINVVDAMTMAKKYNMVPGNTTTTQFVNLLARQLLQLGMEKKELDRMRSVYFSQWPHLPETSGKLVDFRGNWLPRPPGPTIRTPAATGKSDGADVERRFSQESDLSSLSAPQPVKQLSRTKFVPGCMKYADVSCHFRRAE